MHIVLNLYDIYSAFFRKISYLTYDVYDPLWTKVNSCAVFVVSRVGGPIQQQYELCC
jgi:hypothetical protein